MTIYNLIELGNDHVVLWKGMRVVFCALSPSSSPRSPLKAVIELPGGVKCRVFPSTLEPLPTDAA